MIIFKLKKISLCLFICLAILLVVNIFFFINRNTNPHLIYAKKANYAEIYYVDEAPHISGFKTLINDSVFIEINRDNNKYKWEVFVDDSISYSEFDYNPTIKLLNKTHSYKIYYSPAIDTIKLDIMLTKKEEYQKANYSGETNYFIRKNSIPIISTPLFSSKKWVSDYSEVQDNQNREALNLLHNEMKVKETDSTLVKIEKIGAYIISTMEGHVGIPSDTMCYLTPLEQFNFARNNKSDIWCGNFSNIYAYFANLSGIPTRKCGAGGTVDGISLSGHAFCESYIKEQNRWAFVDLTSKKLYVYNTHKQVLNTIDILFLQHTGIKEGISAKIYDQGSVVIKKYEEVDGSERNYFRRGAIFTFAFNIPKPNSIIYKLYRYMSIYPYSLTYSFSYKQSMGLYVIKQTALYLFFLLLFFWILIRLKLYFS